MGRSVVQCGPSLRYFQKGVVDYSSQFPLVLSIELMTEAGIPHVRRWVKKSTSLKTGGRKCLQRQST